MTTTLEPLTATAEAPAPEAPAEITFTAGTLTITAASEEEALRKYKRLVRAEALKAQTDNDWCDSGTNDRLQRLGLRLKGDGIPMRVRVVAERTAYITLDVENEEEAKALLADGESPDMLSLVTATVGRGWKAVVVEEAAPREGAYKVGDPDDTTSGMRLNGSNYVPACEVYSSSHGYCTRPRGHVEAGDRQHAVGNGTSIQGVWNQRAR